MPQTKMQGFGTVERAGYNSDKFYQRKIYPDQLAEPTGVQTEQSISAEVLNKIFSHSSEQMSELPDNSVHLMVTSPPYNVGKDYDADLTQDEFMGMLNRVWQETYRVLAPGGRACINIANLGRKPYLPLNAMIATEMCKLGFLMRGEIIWNKSASAGSSCAWGSWKSPANPVLRDVHEYILVFAKEQFSRSKPKSEDKVSTITRDEFLEFTKSLWSFPTESATKVGHPAPFPMELPWRLIQLYTYSNDVVLDPFMGSGTTAVAAIRANRYFVGYEISSEYERLANERVQAESSRMDFNHNHQLSEMEMISHGE